MAVAEGPPPTHHAAKTTKMTTGTSTTIATNTLTTTVVTPPTSSTARTNPEVQAAANRSQVPPMVYQGTVLTNTEAVLQLLMDQI